MRVLVIGASGAVGAHITRQLTERGIEVTGTCRSVKKEDRIRSVGARPVLLDVLDAAACHATVADARPDAIIYQATALAGRRFGRSLDTTFGPTNRLRTDGTDNVIAAARAAGVGKLVAQSFAPYRYASAGPVAAEDDSLLAAPPATAVATFAAMAHLDEAVTAAGGIALRYGGFYGEPDQMTAAVARRQYPLVGDGRGMMSFVHLHDAAAAATAALEAEGPAVYNITDDEPAPMREWLPALASALGARPPRRIPHWAARLIMGPALSMMTEARGASNAKAKKELGWAPRYPTWRQGFRAIRPEVPY
jgi:nucleoside-diphosphate-sugar epimerase